MKEVAIRWLLVVVASLLLPAGLCVANDTRVVGAGGAVKAVKDHATIRMVSEKVNVWISGSEANVECTFIFKNEGPATEVLMGFPESGGGDIRTPEPGKGFLQFRAFVDGKPVKTRLMKEKDGDGSYRRWWVKKVWFRKGQKRTVKNVYRARLGEVSMGHRFFTYTLRTGASWKGKIGVADIVVAIEGMENFTQWSMKPSGYKREEGRIIWHFEDFEPAEDIRIGWYPYYWGTFIDGGGGGVYPWDFGGPPEIMRGVLWVPVRLLGRWLDAEVAWEEGGRRARVERNGETMFVSPDEGFVTLDSKRIRLPKPAYMREKSLLVPLRPVAEAFGCEVLWDPVSRRTYVRTPEKMVQAGQFPRFMSQPLTRDEASQMTMWELRLMRNEIYARNGYQFSDYDLRHHFYCQPWYEPNPNFNEDLLTEVQRQNVLLIKQAEEEKERTPWPEGRIAFTMRRHDGSDIWVMDADGSDRSLLTSPGMWACQPAWSPDGRKIAFSGGGWGNAADIYVMDSDGSNQVRLTSAQEDEVHPSWFPDASRLAFGRRGRRTQEGDAIWVVNPDGSDQKRIEIAPGYIEFPPSSKAPPGRPWAEGRRVEVSAAHATGLFWSPDANKVALLFGAAEVCIMNVDGSNPRFLGDPPGTDRWCPRWSPDGAEIAFCTGGEIFVADLGRGGVRNVTNSEGFEDSVCWSPDGKRLAVASGGAIWVMNADGSNPRRLAKSEGLESNPCWGPPGEG